MIPIGRGTCQHVAGVEAFARATRYFVLFATSCCLLLPAVRDIVLFATPCAQTQSCDRLDKLFPILMMYKSCTQLFATPCDYYSCESLEGMRVHSVAACQPLPLQSAWFAMVPLHPSVLLMASIQQELANATSELRSIRCSRLCGLHSRSWSLHRSCEKPVQSLLVPLEWPCNTARSVLFASMGMQLTLGVSGAVDVDGLQVDAWWSNDDRHLIKPLLANYEVQWHDEDKSGVVKMMLRYTIV
eukprot:4957241-Amphidinium_carterae.2